MNPDLSNNWRCSRCHTIYRFEDFMKLEFIPVDKNKPEYGNQPVCKCGAVFHRDRWHMLWHDDGYTVSTVDLELGHHSNSDLFDDTIMWYETMIMGPDGFLSFQTRYTTQEEAEAGHWQAVDMLPKIISNPGKYPAEIMYYMARALEIAPDRKKGKVKNVNPSELEPNETDITKEGKN